MVDAFVSCAGIMDTSVAGTVATVNGMQPGVRKRGAKPKYKFMTAEEAVAHRSILSLVLCMHHPTHTFSASALAMCASNPSQGV